MNDEARTKAAAWLIQTLKDSWKNAGTVCHLCGQPGMKEMRDVECRPHLCPHGRPCEPSPLAPAGSLTAVCSECNATTRVGDLLAQAIHRRKEGQRE